MIFLYGGAVFLIRGRAFEEYGPELTWTLGQDRKWTRQCAAFGFQLPSVAKSTGARIQYAKDRRACIENVKAPADQFGLYQSYKPTTNYCRVCCWVNREKMYQPRVYFQYQEVTIPFIVEAIYIRTHCSRIT